MSLFHNLLEIVLLLKLAYCFRVIIFVRLACLIHAASVHPELGSNSFEINQGQSKILNLAIEKHFIDLCLIFKMPQYGIK